MKKLLLVTILSFFFSLIFAQELHFDDLSMHHSEEKEAKDVVCQKIDSIVDFALSKKGNRYKYGASGPNLFDCSGFMYYVFKQFGITLLRTSRAQYTMGKAVEKEDIRKGDLVFFIRGKGIGHVGLVIEVDSNSDYRFIHASNVKNGVKIDHSQREGYRKTFVGARRIIDCKENNIPIILTDEPQNPLLLDSLNALIAPINMENGDSNVTIVSTPPQEKIIYHKVKQGETLSAIARKHRVSVANIKKWNGLKSDMIRIDQRLKIYK